MRYFKYVLVLSLLACLFSLSKISFAEDDDVSDASAEDRQQIYHINDDVDLMPTLKIYYARPSITVRATVPQLLSDSNDENVDAFNQLVADTVKEEMVEFKKQVADNGSTKRNDLAIDFDASVINMANEPLISIRFTVHAMMNGMGPPYRHHRVINFDLNSGESLALEDLFQADTNYLDQLADYSREALNKKLKDKERIMQGTMPDADNYKIWNLSPHGLLITFEGYQVAPSRDGSQTVLIPYTVLEKEIDPDSTLANCLKHKRRCLGNKVLTGGFIDRA